MSSEVVSLTDRVIVGRANRSIGVAVDALNLYLVGVSEVLEVHACDVIAIFLRISPSHAHSDEAVAISEGPSV